MLHKRLLWVIRSIGTHTLKYSQWPWASDPRSPVPAMGHMLKSDVEKQIQYNPHTKFVGFSCFSLIGIEFLELKNTKHSMKIVWVNRIWIIHNLSVWLSIQLASYLSVCSSVSFLNFLSTLFPNSLWAPNRLILENGVNISESCFVTKIWFNLQSPRGDQNPPIHVVLTFFNNY